MKYTPAVGANALFYGGGVSSHSEIKRIMALPRRVWREDQLENLASAWTAQLKSPQGTQRLRPLQAQALAELSQLRGAFMPLGVGIGKTLISGLAPTVKRSARPCIVTVASLNLKTEKELTHEYAPHWKIHRGIRIFSYESLGREDGWIRFLQYDPDFIFLDEAHRAKNPQAGVTRRFHKFRKDRPNATWCAASGTICKDGIKDFWHLLEWCLREGSPAPQTRHDAYEWSSALDLGQQTFAPRRSLKALVSLMIESHEDDLTRARKGFYERLTCTPGVIASKQQSVACPLYVEPFVMYPGKAAEDHFVNLRDKWKNPDGIALGDGMQVRAVARQLALGFHYYANPRPPDEWLNARSRWASFARAVLSHTKAIDTEKQVRDLVAAGKYKGSNENAEEILADWEKWSALLTPTVQARWHDSAVIEGLKKLILKSPPTLVWTEHVVFGRALAQLCGIPYVGNQGLTDDGQSAESFAGKTSIVLSSAANSAGRNLQAWAMNIETAQPASALACEQKWGRSHRAGQNADQVEVKILFACSEHVADLEKARVAAKMTSDLMGQDQKLLIADYALSPAIKKSAKGAFGS